MIYSKPKTAYQIKHLYLTAPQQASSAKLPSIESVWGLDVTSMSNK